MKAIDAGRRKFADMRLRQRRHRRQSAGGCEYHQAEGFSLYMLKAIIKGRGGEVIELAQTNLRH